VFADTGAHTLIVKGRGDPLLSAGDIDSIARQLAPLLSPSVAWNVVVDASYFDDLYWGAGWTWDEEPAAYGMFISPLMLNNNAITVNVVPGLYPGDSVEVTLDPPAPFLAIENHATTTADTAANRLQISRKWRDRSNTITVDGQMRLGGRPARQRLSVWQPELFIGHVFAERLRAVGIPVQAVRLDTVSAGAQSVLVYSHALDTVVTFLNKESDNLSAEALLKTLGAHAATPPGSAEAGIHVIYDTLAVWGVDTNSISIADGSGLSRYNLTSAGTITTLLQRMYEHQETFGAFFHSLPIAGVDGTIGSRMKGTPAEGNLRAKTGTLSAVSALSGYVRSAEGEMIAFSILMQSFPESSRRYRGVQDAIGVLLSRFSRKSL
jgi:D-alanyl-D-alanine carboxypeptidase/D-alanyl-D-alanine-endopeptidase (penicillin-binding protein 4)